MNNQIDVISDMRAFSNTERNRVKDMQNIAAATTTALQQQITALQLQLQASQTQETLLARQVNELDTFDADIAALDRDIQPPIDSELAQE